MRTTSGSIRKGKVWVRTIHTVVMLLLFLTAMVAILFAMFPTLRANDYNMDRDGDKIYIDDLYGKSLEISDAFSFAPLWIPEGCVLIQQEMTFDFYYQYYKDDTGSGVFI